MELPDDPTNMGGGAGLADRVTQEERTPISSPVGESLF